MRIELRTRLGLATWMNTIVNHAYFLGIEQTVGHSRIPNRVAYANHMRGALHSGENLAGVRPEPLWATLCRVI
jgi:hypothetical protein